MRLRAPVGHAVDKGGGAVNGRRLRRVAGYAVWLAFIVLLVVLPPQRWGRLLLGELIVATFLLIELLVYAILILRNLLDRPGRDRTP
jgi:hypothetical protein